MNETVSGAWAVEASQRLLTLAREQTQALETGELERFRRLAGERAALQGTFDRPIPAGIVPAVRTALEEVAAIDRHNIALVRELMAQTRQTLQRLRRGHAAARGYGRPGSHLVALTSIVDRRG